MIVIALLEWIALAIQFWLSVNLAITIGTPVVRGVTNYFSYFTILCNLLVALVVSFTLGAGNDSGAIFLTADRAIRCRDLHRHRRHRLLFRAAAYLGSAGPPENCRHATA
jgi:hypothetical protein